MPCEPPQYYETAQSDAELETAARRVGFAIIRQ